MKLFRIGVALVALAAVPVAPFLFAGTETLTELRLRRSALPRFTLDQAIRQALDGNLNLSAERFNVTVAQTAVLTASLRPNAIRCPVTLVLGDADSLMSQGRATRLQQALREASSDRLACDRLGGVAHMAPEEAPDRLGTIVGEMITAAT